jgi:glycerol uptake facilitator protein
VGEALGTFILVLFGVGAVHAAALSGSQSGLWQVSVVWGVAVALAIYAVGAVSGAHINPAMTVAFAVFRKFPVRKVGPYILAQLVGAFLAAALLFALYGGVISRFEQSHGLVRGQAGSERSAMAYGEYFPNPTAQDASPETVSLAQAMLAEGVGTAMLALLVFAVTDRHNPGRPNGSLFALFIGLSVAVIISIIAPLTQAGLNPARDFGPRLFSYLAGWGAIAIPGPRGGFFTVYILAPILGAVAGAAGYEFLLHSAMRTTLTAEKSQEQGES